jgi:hypothetical protein
MTRSDVQRLISKGYTIKIADPFHHDANAGGECLLLEISGNGPGCWTSVLEDVMPLVDEVDDNAETIWQFD